MRDTDLMQPWLIEWLSEREEIFGRMILANKCVPALGVHERCEHDKNWQEPSFKEGAS